MLSDRKRKEFFCFNSKMVRLKGNKDFNGRKKVVFQFQNGSIKRERTPEQNNQQNDVSIPKWFD